MIADLLTVCQRLLDWWDGRQWREGTLAEQWRQVWRADVIRRNVSE